MFLASEEGAEENTMDISGTANLSAIGPKQNAKVSLEESPRRTSSGSNYKDLMEFSPPVLSRSIEGPIPCGGAEDRSGVSGRTSSQRETLHRSLLQDRTEFADEGLSDVRLIQFSNINSHRFLPLVPPCNLQVVESGGVDEPPQSLV